MLNPRSNQKAEAATTLSDSAAELKGSEFVGAIGALTAGDVVIGAKVNTGFALLELEELPEAELDEAPAALAAAARAAAAAAALTFAAAMAR